MDTLTLLNLIHSRLQVLTDEEVEMLCMHLIDTARRMVEDEHLNLDPELVPKKVKPLDPELVPKKVKPR